MSTLRGKSARDPLAHPEGISWPSAIVTGAVGASLPAWLGPAYVWVPAVLVWGFLMGYVTTEIRWRLWRRRVKRRTAQAHAELVALLIPFAGGEKQAESVLAAVEARNRKRAAAPWN